MSNLFPTLYPSDSPTISLPLPSSPSLSSPLPSSPSLSHSLSYSFNFPLYLSQLNRLIGGEIDDVDFRKTFLLTYPLFMSAEELMHYVMNKYVLINSLSLSHTHSLYLSHSLLLSLSLSHTHTFIPNELTSNFIFMFESVCVTH